jgi:hypothetical protein
MLQVISEKRVPHIEVENSTTALPPPPLIDPALDYLYNPTVVDTIQRTKVSPITTLQWWTPFSAPR